MRDSGLSNRGGSSAGRGGRDFDKEMGYGIGLSGSDTSGHGARRGPHVGGSPSPVSRGPRQMGVVKFFNTEKGYGFITPESGGEDVFVHVSAVERSSIGVLDKGLKVSFETEPDRRGKGPKAVNLQSSGDEPVEEEEAEAFVEEIKED